VAIDRYDDIVTGSGSSGAVVAARLSENPDRRVLLIEAGPDYSSIEQTPSDLLYDFMPDSHDWGWSAYGLRRRTGTVRARHGVAVFGFCMALMRPRSVGRITLESIDPTVQPRIDLKSFADPSDMQRIIPGFRLARDVCRTPEFLPFVKSFLIDDAIVASDEVLARPIRHEQLHTTHRESPRGSPDDERAVVDDKGRVHGIENLWVADASIMPTGVRSKPHLTCIMMGDRIGKGMLVGD
jgi:choline dehydrogenase-like flavoprotein